MIQPVYKSILKLPVKSSNANVSPWGDACGWHVQGGCEVYGSDASERVRDRNAVRGKKD